MCRCHIRKPLDSIGDSGLDVWDTRDLNWMDLAGVVLSLRGRMRQLQGDHSGSSQPPVDMKTKVAFSIKGFSTNPNFCFDVSGRVGAT